MNTKVITFISAVAMLASCADVQAIFNKEKKSKLPMEHTAQNSIDWPGTYVGSLPQADGSTREVMLILADDYGFTYITRDGNNDAVTKKGTFKWKGKNSSAIRLAGLDKNERFFIVGENQLLSLDRKGNRVTDESGQPYRLVKIDPQLQERYWKLVELGGEEIVRSPDGTGADIHLIFKSDKTLIGYGGCNRLSGGYTLEGGSLTFGNVAATMMMCPDADVEIKFLAIFDKVGGYVVNGDAMTLLDKEGNPLANFVEVIL